MARLVETKLKGYETIIIIHVELQSYAQTGFNERMFHYFSLLYNKCRKPVLLFKFHLTLHTRWHFMPGIFF